VRGSVHPLLDLHGLTGDEARLRAEGWLRDRAAAGERTVVLVTGRGNHSQGPPVLPGEIRHLLDGLRGALVDGWELSDGGGAFHVRLRRVPSPAAPPTPDARLLRGLAPELRRRAEESLAELGISPTPALVLAEARRIQAEGEGG
jgi:hypothetical protein